MRWNNSFKFIQWRSSWAKISNWPFVTKYNALRCYAKMKIMIPYNISSIKKTVIFIIKLFTSALQKHFFSGKEKHIFRQRKTYFLSSKVFKTLPIEKIYIYLSLYIWEFVDRFFSNNFQDCNNLQFVKCIYKIYHAWQKLFQKH